jgi:hypothetical protein
MKVVDLFKKKIIKEAFGEYEIREISRTDQEELQRFSDLVNEGSQLTWKLNPTKLTSKMGSRGSLWGLYNGDEMVGTVGIKEADIGGFMAGEMGYLFILPEHRSLKNVSLMLKTILKESKRFDLLFATTNKNNRAINVLMDRTKKMDYVLTTRSPYSANMLNFWLSGISNKKISRDEQIQALTEKFGKLG